MLCTCTLAKIGPFCGCNSLTKITLDNSILVLSFSLGKVSAVLISASVLVCEWLGGHLLLVVGSRGVIGGGGRGVRGRSGGVSNRDGRGAHSGSKQQGTDKSLTES